MKPATANQPPKCFVNFHLTPEEFGLWNYLRSVSYESGIAYLSGRQIAQHFDDTDKNAVYRIIDRLFAKAWLEEFSPFYRTTNGSYVPRSAKVLDHATWVQAHGSASCRPVPNLGQGRPVPIPDLSRNPDSPVPNLGHSCPEIGNNIDVDVEVDSEKVVGVEEKCPLALLESKPTPKTAGKKDFIDKDRLFHEMRGMWRKENLMSVYNTTPRQDGQLLKLARTHGVVDFLGGYAIWLRNDAADHIEMRYADSLSFPLRKFIEQASSYIQEFRNNENGCRSHKNYAHVFGIARTLGCGHEVEVTL